MNSAKDTKLQHTLINENGETITRHYDEKGAEIMRRTQAALRIHASLSSASAVNGPSASSLAALNEKQQKDQSQNDTAIAILIADEIKQLDSAKSNIPVKRSDKAAPAKTVVTKPKKAFVINPTSMLEKISRSDTVISNIVSFFVEAPETKSQTVPSVFLTSAVALIRTSRPNSLINLFKQKLAIEPFKPLVKELCQAVVYGDYDKVKTMLDKNPCLVLYKTQVEDYSFYEDEEVNEKGEKKRIYRKLEGTAFQLSLGAEDISRKNYPDEGMADLIKGYFIKACKNDEKAAAVEIASQFEEQFPQNEFPEYYEADEKKREEIIKQKNSNDTGIKAVEAIAKAVETFEKTKTDGTSIYKDKTIQDSLKAFKDYFKIKPENVFTKGKHFNMQILIKAFELCYQKYDNNADTEMSFSNKTAFFWIKVIGYIQRFLPACYAQAFCQGLYVAAEEKLTRNLKFCNNNSTELYYYPLARDKQLGSLYAAGWRGPSGLCRPDPQCTTPLLKIMSEKATSLGCFIQRPNSCDRKVAP